MNYELAYKIGFHLWEDLAEHPPFADKLLELVAREENGHGPSYGPALDLGCGSAVWGVRLAKRGWAVTGVDLVEKALRRARERVDEAEVQMRLVQADVTALRQADVGSNFRLVVDTGTFHGLTDSQREAMGREVDAVCADDATVLLDCFEPRRRGPLPRGASRADVERAFPGWKIVNVEIADTEPDALARLFKFEERFYRLRRADSMPWPITLATQAAVIGFGAKESRAARRLFRGLSSRLLAAAACDRSAPNSSWQCRERSRRATALWA